MLKELGNIGGAELFCSDKPPFLMNTLRVLNGQFNSHWLLLLIGLNII